MLYHFSEDPEIKMFHPRIRPANPYGTKVVWAIDAWHMPLYWFPRDCPRIAFWQGPETSEGDAEQWLHGSRAKMVVATESCWFERIQETKLYMYHFWDKGFEIEDVNAGYYVSQEIVEPVKVEAVGNLIWRHRQVGNEVRFVPSLHPLADRLPQTSVQFSMIRMRYAQPC